MITINQSSLFSEKKPKETLAVASDFPFSQCTKAEVFH